MMNTFFALDPTLKAQRRAVLSQHATQIGVDYVEVVNNSLLRLYFVPTAPARLTANNLKIWGAAPGALVEQTRVQLDSARLPASGQANRWEIPLQVALAGSSEEQLLYTLEVVNVANLDPFFTQATFTLQSDRVSKIDPRHLALTSTPLPPTPVIDYLGRDYQSMRQLILNRLSVLMPGWQERNPADVGHTLVEILAYAADQLSYYQDAVATEAYLGTARRRISVKRHARLVDYRLHEGCNARVWVQLQVNSEIKLPRHTPLLTRTSATRNLCLTQAEYDQALIDGATVFETMHAVLLTAEQNCLPLYDWGLPSYTLPVGATSAALRGHFPSLQPGQVVILEEVRTPGGQEANPAHRHPVRLIKVEASSDLLYAHQPLTHITWHTTDALPFALTAQTAVGRGNLVLADHGRTVERDDLQPPTAPGVGRYQPQLRRLDLTFSVPYTDCMAQACPPAAALLTQDPRQAVAAIHLKEQRSAETWVAYSDLLNSDRFTNGFVVEVENDGRTYLRFGDGVRGRQPATGAYLQATYRVGKGHAGNVGQETITRLFAPAVDGAQAIIAVRNPLAAQGGVDPEPLAQVRLYAPQTFYSQQRCVAPDDFAAVAEGHPEVQKAVVNWQWSGSWYSAVVVVDRLGGRPIDATFTAELLRLFEPYRVAGDDIAIQAPTFVPLELALTVTVAKTHFVSTVKQALLAAFSTIDLPGGGRGYFHPDNFTIGQPVYLSPIITHAARVSGVAQVTATRFQRLGRPSPTALLEERIVLGPTEVARLDNQPGAPQRGRLELILSGGR